MRRTTAMFTIAAVAGFFSSSADVSAQIATFQFQGTVAGVINSTYQSTPNPYTGVVAIGDPWSATVRVNLNSPPTPTSGLGNFADALVSSSFRFSNGRAFDLGISDFIHIESPHVIMAYLATNEVNGWRPHIVNFNFYNWTSPAPTNLHEFASRFSLSAIGNPQVSIYADSGPSHHIQLNLLSAFLVPEPSSLSLLILASLCAGRRIRPTRRSLGGLQS